MQSKARRAAAERRIAILFDTALWAAGFAIFALLFVILLNARYPLIGQDYANFFPRLLAGRWHILHQGLQPMRYTPFFAGGMPMYGNPEDLSYSLVQWLAVPFDPWTAVQVSSVVCLAVGYVGWFLFGRDVLRLDRQWARLFSFVIAANGFVFLRLAVGFLTFQTFPLLGMLYWLLLCDTKDSMRSLSLRAAGVALTVAFIFYAGGNYVLIFGAWGLCMLTVFDMLRSKKPLARLIVVSRRTAACAVPVLAITLSKLMAIDALMRFFPRDAAFPWISSADALGAFFWGLWAFPQRAADFPGVYYGMHESSMFLSPIVAAGLLCAAGWWIHAVQSRMLRRRAVLAALVLALFALVTFQCIRGYGFLVTPFSHVFPLSSMRVGERFLYPFSLLLSMVGIVALERTIKRWLRPGASAAVAAISAAVTVVCFFCAYQPALQDTLVTFPADAYATTVRTARDSVLPSLSRVRNEPDFHQTLGLEDHDALLAFNRQLRPGRADLVIDGFFNVMNPACDQYPEENGCQPRTRIRANDRANLEAFLNGRPVTWKLPWWQIAADGISLASLIACVLIVIVAAFSKRRAMMRAWKLFSADLQALR